MSTYTLYRIIPFSTFMVFIGCEELLRLLGRRGVIELPDTIFLYLYPFRALAAGLLLLLFWKHYDEICFRDMLNVRTTLLSIGVGTIVFILWINMPWTISASGPPTGYNPTGLSDFFTQNTLIAIRLLSASIVVPVVEEVFWRSWMLRYIINPAVAKVPLGTFTWGSFLISTVLFGLEHHYVYAGLVAGTAYALLLYRTKSITQCILAHGVTNLLLSIYVLSSCHWQYW